MSNIATKKVFLVYSPPWAEWSAGIRVLHYLCDHLNNLGFEALMVIHGPKIRLELSESLNTPVLTKKYLKEIHDSGKEIVSVYTESIIGNPLNTPHVIRWILNYPGLLAGPTAYPNEMVFPYTKSIAGKMHNSKNLATLFVPALKSEEIRSAAVFESSVNGEEYEVVYAQKYRALGGVPAKLVRNQIELVRFGKEAPDRKKTLSLIKGAELVHVYENTTVVTEAVLLGTPVICHKNEYFDELLAGDELNMSGISWDASQIEKPNMTENFQLLEKAEEAAKQRIFEIFSNLSLKGNAVGDQADIVLPRRGLITRHSLSRAKNVLLKKGPFVLIKFFRNYVNR